MCIYVGPGAYVDICGYHCLDTVGAFGGTTVDRGYKKISENILPSIGKLMMKKKVRPFPLLLFFTSKLISHIVRLL